MLATIAEEPWHGADGLRLRKAMASELAARYERPDQETEPPTAETASVFLVARDPGVATHLLRALEGHALRNGIGTLLPATGTEQPDAARFHEREGYQRIDGYGPYAGEPMAVCFTLGLE